MDRSLAQRIIAQVEAYLGGDNDLDALDEWLALNAWDVRQREDEPAAAICGELMLALAEYSNGDWTEDELRDLFRQAISAPAGAGRG